MPLTFEGSEPTAITFNSESATMAVLNSEVVWTSLSTVAFTEDTADVEFSVSQAGVVSLSIGSGVIESETYLNNQNLGTVTVDTLRTNNLVVRVPNLPLIYSNANETISFSVTFTQIATALVPFAFANAGVSCSVTGSGNVEVNSSVGTASLGSGQVSSYPTVSVATPRTISVRVQGTVPNGFSNSGSSFDLTGNCPATQPVFVPPNFGFPNAGVSCTVDGQTGIVSASATTGSVQSFTPTSYPTVSSLIARTISVRVTGTIPGGFANAGNSFDLTDNCIAVQQAFTLEAFRQSDWTGSVSVTPLGTILADNGNVGSVTTNPTSFSSNTTNLDIQRTISVTLINIPSGYSNTGGSITFNVIVNQPSSLPEFTDSDWSGVVSVSQSGGVTATAGNGGPITILTTSVPANTGVADITVQINVQVTIPSGFRFFGSTITITRAAIQAGVGVPTFTNTVSIGGSVTGATIDASQVVLEAESGAQDSATFTITPLTNREFTSVGNVSISSSNTVLASATHQFDPFGLGGILVTVSGTVGSSNQTASLTVSGAAIATGSVTSVTVNGSSTITNGNTNSYSVTHTTSGTLTGSPSFLWTITNIVGSVAIISGASNASTVAVRGISNLGTARLTCTVTYPGNISGSGDIEISTGGLP